MPNRNILICQMLHDRDCREAVTRALRRHPKAHGFSVFLHVRREDAYWDVLPVDPEGQESAPRYGCMFMARNPAEVAALRRLLKADPARWKGPFAVPLPDFSPIPLPWAKVTPDYVATIDRLKARADAPLWLCDLDPAEVIARRSDMPRHALAPLADRLEGRAYELQLNLREMVGSTLIHTTRIPDGQSGTYEWCVRATIHIAHAVEMWLTNLEVVERVKEIPRRISADGSSPWELRNERTKWEIHLPDVTRQIVMLRLLERLNVRHDQDSAALMPALQDLMARADAQIAAMTP